MNGIINLDKPAGITSAAAVNRVKRLLPRGTKIGHAGTLDPFATGVLLLLIGRATKMCESLMAEEKEYEATIKLGATTPTDDPESQETPYPQNSPAHGPGSISRADIEKILPRFVGAIAQRPPTFSAIKLAGQRSYKLARRGEMPSLQPRTVQIHHIELISYDWPVLKIKITCGRGTYIRALARDLGEALRVGGYLTQLRRTRAGRFFATDAVNLAELSHENISQQLEDAYE
jgi:tRNA pseudouridine55 synthase